METALILTLNKIFWKNNVFKRRGGSGAIGLHRQLSSLKLQKKAASERDRECMDATGRSSTTSGFARPFRLHRQLRFLEGIKLGNWTDRGPTPPKQKKQDHRKNFLHQSIE